MLANAGARRYVTDMTICFLDSPVGRLTLEAEGDTLTGVRWTDARERSTAGKPTAVLTEAARQLDRYFRRKLRRFDLPLSARGTEFQRRVWRMMSDIPYGETATYGGMAMALGSGPRAVGTAWDAIRSRSSCLAIACWRAAARKAASRAAAACRPSGSFSRSRASCCSNSSRLVFGRARC